MLDDTRSQVSLEDYFPASLCYQLSDTTGESFKLDLDYTMEQINLRLNSTYSEEHPSNESSEFQAQTHTSSMPSTPETEESIQEVIHCGSRGSRIILTSTSQTEFAVKIVEFLQNQPDQCGSDKELFAAVCSLLSKDCLATRNLYTPRRCFHSALKPMIAAGTIQKIQKGLGKSGRYYRWASKDEKLESLQKEVASLKLDRDMWKQRFLDLQGS